MPKLSRFYQKIFASSAGLNEIGKFGSLAAGNPETTIDPEEVQELNNFLDGWFSAISGNNSPAIEDMNGLFFLLFRQLAYIFEVGVPEYDTETNYFTHSIVMDSNGILYRSLIDNNLNQSLSDTTKWRRLFYKEEFSTKTANYTATPSDDVILVDCTSGNVTITLPQASTVNSKKYIIKKVDTTANKIIVDGNASETIDGALTRDIQVAFSSLTLICDGIGWYRI